MARKINVLQTIVVEIADTNAAAIVNVSYIKRIDRIIFCYLIYKMDT
jgi:hypothetical protein